ncbi:hypothetical protein V6N12_052788 [Hibiscus sabdariffa]|uniref:PH domain-containing protein n=1 Tax=Hibiscus sabdariffa TaxID=183260 RepID=A0ABR2C2S2_9ROSI
MGVGERRRGPSALALATDNGDKRELGFTSNAKCQTVSLYSLASSCCVCWNPSLSLREEVDKFEMSSCSVRSSSKKLENIDENGPPRWLQLSCPLPETPTESMEYLARSWSLSAMELSKALASSAGNIETNDSSTTASRQSLIQHPPADNSPPIVSPRESEDLKELFLLHQTLNPEFLSNQQLLKNGICKNIVRGRTMGKRLKDQKERKKQEIRSHNAQLHAAVSVAGVAAAVAALAASNAMLPEMETTCLKTSSKVSTAIASAAALVASHCIEIAEDMGADHDQILTVVNSAMNVRTSGDVLTLTAGAATALRGAAALRARLQKTGTLALGEDGNGPNISTALNFVATGGELLKRTRKGALHWKQVSFYINSNWQVVVKLKSKHMGGTYTKKRKCKLSLIGSYLRLIDFRIKLSLPVLTEFTPCFPGVILGVHDGIPAWPGREKEDNSEQRAYFGIKTAERIIEFECRSRSDKQMWTDGIRLMLNYHNTMAYF